MKLISGTACLQTAGRINHFSLRILVALSDFFHNISTKIVLQSKCNWRQFSPRVALQQSSLLPEYGSAAFSPAALYQFISVKSFVILTSVTSRNKIRANHKTVNDKVQNPCSRSPAKQRVVESQILLAVMCLKFTI